MRDNHQQREYPGAGKPEHQDGVVGSKRERRQERSSGKTQFVADGALPRDCPGVLRAGGRREAWQGRDTSVFLVTVRAHSAALYRPPHGSAGRLYCRPKYAHYFSSCRSSSLAPAMDCREQIVLSLNVGLSLRLGTSEDRSATMPGPEDEPKVARAALESRRRSRPFSYPTSSQYGRERRVFAPS